MSNPVSAVTSGAPRRSIPSPIAFALAAWAIGSLAVAASGMVGRAPFVIPVLFVGVTAGWIAAYRRSDAVRAFADGLNLRALVLVHLIRIPFGAYFLYELSRGALSETFALRAGPEDIAAGVLAIAAAAALPATTRARRRLVLGFSLFGLADIVLAVASGQYLFFIARDPVMLEAITRLPYPLLPTLVVPVIILTHLLVLVRLRRGTQIR